MKRSRALRALVTTSACVVASGVAVLPAVASPTTQAPSAALRAVSSVPAAHEVSAVQSLQPVSSTSLEAPSPAAAAASGHRYVAGKNTKINIMGEWAHPDDDTSIIGPCGVWNQRYHAKCGIIMITRGEGGGNAVGTETGPALGLRRENEDRVAHYRSGTVDIFNVDRVDFFYNQSAPLTEDFWNEQETLRRVTRIIRTTQPDIYLGFTPTLAAGHGNHQVAGRLIWEGMQAAADPNMFPDQLRGPHALSTWQVKKIFSGGSTSGSGGTSTAANCVSGFVPTPGQNLDTVVGVWTGYASPYLWPKGNLQGQPVGSPKIWQQVNDEGRSAYPTQSRVMYQGESLPGCPRFAMTDSFVPFQPNTLPNGSANPFAGLDDAILYGATKVGPGGLPLGTTEYLTFSRFYNVPGVPFKATLHVKAGSGRLSTAAVALTVPDGWAVDRPKKLRNVTNRKESTATFTVTPSQTAPVEQNAKVSALLTAGRKSGYTDNVVRIVSPAEGRFQRWGKWAEYDNWLAKTAPEARRLGRSDAVDTIGLGQSATVPVVVHNWSAQAQSGAVSLALPAGIAADSTSKSYGPLAPGAETTVTFRLTSTGTSLPANQLVNIPITTSYSAPAGSGSETLSLSVVPQTTIPQVTTAPTIDAEAAPGEYTGPKLDIGRIWQGAGYCTGGTADCGVSGTSDPDSSYAQVSWSSDALYFFVHIRDDYQSYAVTPQECVAHWLADSVEFQIDPRGTASQVNKDTANTFKLGVFPYTNDPSNYNGNGVNGPCWERDADNHQGYSTGPLAQTVAGAPNAPGVEVASSAKWVGSNQTMTDHAYAGGGYNLEVKIPMADLPSAVDPNHMGLNITPYDEDNTAAVGTTTLRHIDNSTRLGWSAFNSVQSDPYRWGHASLAGYMPPPGRSTTPPAPIVGHPNLDGVNSPQTIAQSARDGVPIAGRTPAPRNDSVLQVSKPTLTQTGARVKVTATGSGIAHLYLWSGDIGQIPVYLTSCTKANDPPPDYGLTPCAVTDGGIPQWSPDMSGHVLGSRIFAVHPGQQYITIPLDKAARRTFDHGGRALMSFETVDGSVQAFNVPASPRPYRVNR